MLKNGKERSNLELIDEVSVEGIRLMDRIQSYRDLDYMVGVTPSRKWVYNMITGNGNYDARYDIKVYKRKDDQIAN